MTSLARQIVYMRRLAGQRPRLLFWSVVVLGAFVLVGCSTGSYPFDIFPEMHYQQSYKFQEPPRLGPPEGSVPRSVPVAHKTGQELYAINCAICHGQGLRGDGPVLQLMQTKYGYEPLVNPDLTDPEVQQLPDEVLVGFITGGVNVMPSFKNLLTEEERQLIVDYLREVSGTKPPPARPPTEQPDALELGQQVFTTLALPPCTACHTIEGISTAQVGPELTHIGTVAATRRSGVAAEQYIRESILDPGIFVVQGFPNAMPPGSARSLTPEQLEALVAYLLNLK